MIKDKTTIKEEYKSGGKNRQYVLDKAVRFILAKNPKFGTQGDRHHFLLIPIQSRRWGCLTYM